MTVYEHDDALRKNHRRARIVKVDDTGTQQLVDLKALKKDQPQKVHRLQLWGLSGNPVADAELLMLLMGGGSDRHLAMGGEHKDYRPKNLKSGETKLYDSLKQFVYLSQAGITIDAGEGKKPITLKCGNAVVTVVDGKITAKVGDMTLAVSAGRIDLGADPAPNAVMTDAGPSTKVFAVT